MERSPVMEALLAEAPRATDVARAIASQLSVIGPIEDLATQLQDASQAVFAGSLLARS